jgi:hypothetical protein
MTIRYATIWNDRRPRATPLAKEGRSEAEQADVPMENAPVQAKKPRAAKGTRRTVCSGERLAALLDTHRWTQRRPKR